MASQSEIFKFPTNSAKHLLTLQKHKNVWLLTMLNLPDNRFNQPFMDAFHQALDHVENDLQTTSTGNPLALVTTSQGKFYSNGLDLNWIFKTGNFDFIHNGMEVLLRRFIALPFPTIACLNGHTFAGGFLLAMCHDYRVMVTTKGFMCLNEIDLPGRLNPGLAAIIRTKIPPGPTLRSVFFEAHRFTAKEALEKGLIDATADSYEELIKKGLEFGEKWGTKTAKAGYVIYDLKKEVYIDAVEKLKIHAPISMETFQNTFKPRM